MQRRGTLRSAPTHAGYLVAMGERSGPCRGSTTHLRHNLNSSKCSTVQGARTCARRSHFVRKKSLFAPLKFPVRAPPPSCANHLNFRGLSRCDSRLGKGRALNFPVNSLISGNLRARPVRRRLHPPPPSLPKPATDSSRTERPFLRPFLARRGLQPRVSARRHRL
jgi:hypothetical protein